MVLMAVDNEGVSVHLFYCYLVSVEHTIHLTSWGFVWYGIDINPVAAAINIQLSCDNCFEWPLELVIGFLATESLH